MEKIIVAASGNVNKIREIETILGAFGLHVISRDEAGVPKDFDVVEDGRTFEENSRKKAEEIMKLCGKISIADDSGLMVDALGGDPGVYSARFAGEPTDDRKNNQKLLRLMEDVPDEKRSAKFVSVVTMVWPDGNVLTARGECPGTILRTPRGSNGFGYDPLFVPDGFDQTFAELGADTKNRISHRARALKVLEAQLKDRKI
ncbi:MAG: XTP/dITP diphosphatase [Anaerovoracaceae bacterium]|jgi:XTP/dITP diphosphohydrolase